MEEEDQVSVETEEEVVSDNIEDIGNVEEVETEEEEEESEEEEEEVEEEEKPVEPKPPVESKNDSPIDMENLVATLTESILKRLEEKTKMPDKKESTKVDPKQEVDVDDLVNKKVEAQLKGFREELAAKAETDRLNALKKRLSKDLSFPELVTGSTEEEIRASVKAAKKKEDDFVKTLSEKLGTNRLPGKVGDSLNKLYSDNNLRNFDYKSKRNSLRDPKFSEKLAERKANLPVYLGKNSN